MQGKGEKSLGFQTFRSHVDDFINTSCGERQGFVNLPLCKGGIYVGGTDTGFIQGFYLVLHQGDKRGDYQSNPGQQQGRNLVTQGFSGSGGHDGKGIPAGKCGGYDFLLAVPEGIVSEIVF